MQSLMELTGQESGIILDRASRWGVIINWASEDRILCVRDGELWVVDPADLDVECELQTPNVWEYLGGISCENWHNPDQTERGDFEVAGKVYRLTNGVEVIAPEGWH